MPTTQTDTRHMIARLETILEYVDDQALADELAVLRAYNMALILIQGEN